MLYEGVEGGELRGIHSESVVGHELWATSCTTHTVGRLFDLHQLVSIDCLCS